jgi:hypothetical protein
MSNNISITTDLMKNYKQTELMSPEKKFEALQTNIGDSLLFSIGSDDVLYVTQETVGHSTGWEKIDLSTAQIAKSFPNKTGMTCKTFEAAQSVADGTIGMAMVITDGTNDSLFLCLGNSNVDTSWTKKPIWINFSYDNPVKNVTIVDVFMSETVNNTQYIVADILRDPNSAEKLISRYYIDVKSTDGFAWHPHDVSIDLEADTYISCLGRQYLPNSPHQPTIDGLYTLGQVVGIPQLIFQPLYNVFNPAIPALSARLTLPGNIVPECMASCRKSDNSTDLYVCSTGGLYYFASSNQTDGSTGVLLSQNPMFTGVKKMYASHTNDSVMVWGLNSDDSIFYTTCLLGAISTPAAWSYPLPILTQVDLFSPYINVADNGNTFFAVAGNTMKKMVKSPQNTIWTSQSIALPAPNNVAAQKFSSYTTRIQVNNESNQPVVNTPISISAGTRVGVYINHLYYVLGAKPLVINTDQFGSITIVEWVNNLQGTKLNITNSDGKVSTVNPMDAPMAKIATLNTPEALKSAIITNADGTTRPLVSTSASTADLQTVASSNQNLGTLYNSFSSPKPSARNSVIEMSVGGNSDFNILDAIWVEAGDLLSWLESGIDYIFQVIKDAATDVWHFIANIAGKVYAFVIDTVDKVVGAIEWLYEQIKTAIVDVIQFLEFLFGWEDILITHRVMKNVFIQFTQHSIDNLSNTKGDIVTIFQSLQNDINKWADIPNFDQTANSTTSTNPALAGQNSGPASLAIHHFQGNVANSSSTFTAPSTTEAIFQDLLNLLAAEGDTLTGAYDAIKTDIVDQFGTLTITQVIKKFVAIVTDTLLQTVENVLLAVIDVFIHLAQGMVDLLTKTLEIPVLSTLYHEITGEDLSFLDVICLIGAIPTTIAFKIGSSVAGAGAAPFPKGDPFTDGMINAKSFSEIQSLFFKPSTPPPAHLRQGVGGMAMAMARVAIDDVPVPVLDETRLKVFGVVAGFFAFAGSLVVIVTSSIQKAFDTFGRPFPFAKTLALINGIGNVAYVSPNLATWVNVQTDNWYQQMNNAVTAISIVKGFINIPLATLDSTSKAAKISPAIESIINLVWNVPVIMNIIVNKDRWNTDYKSLIVESIGNFAFNIGGMMEFPISVMKDPETKLIATLVQDGFVLVYGICMPIAGGIYEWAPDQNHG